MAVSGVGSSNSIYGTRNVITGLASGMDTEGMIENAISGYKTKINSLSQKRTKAEWQQEAYRSIVTKMAGFTNKYADYRSSTNLMSPSFFNQAVKTVSQGENASKVSASGKTGSNVQINGVKQLARAATYRVSGGAINGSTNADGLLTATGSGTFDLAAKQPISTVSGKLSITYGGSSARSYLDVSFGELDNFKNAQEMADAINKQLESQTISTSSGANVKATNMLKAKVEGGNVVFEDVSGGKNEFFINSASGDIAKTLNVKTGSGAKSLEIGGTALTKEVNTSEYLSHATMDITLDGVTKKIQMPTMDEVLAKLDEKYPGGKDKETGEEVPYFKELKEKIARGEDLTSANSRQLRDQAYLDVLQDKIDSSFGKLEGGKSKLQVSDVNDDTKSGSKGIQLQFTAGQKGSSFQIGGDKAKAMGLGDAGTASYFSTNTTLKDMGVLKDLKPEMTTDADGKEVAKTDANGKNLYAFTVNGVKIGEFTEDTTLGTLMNKINGNKDANVSVSYSKTTNQFTFTAKETGVAGKIEFGGGLAQKMFGDTSTAGDAYEKGQDAIFNASINGVAMDLTRSSNTVDLDGLSVNLKGTFGYENGSLDPNTEAVTFSSSADSDKIVDAIKSMVEDYNAMAKEIKEAYSTLPMQRSNGKYYEPLTDEDQEDMSDKAIESWNEKAKAGILFGDRDLQSLYQRMTKAISMTGADGADLKAAGITVNYSNGLTTLALDENKLRATLETDPDRVTDIFTKSTETGSATKGFLQALKEPLDLYGKAEGVNLSTGTKGVLVNKAGHPLAASTMYNNTIQQQLDKIDQEIEKWQDKMTDRVDYYTNKFSQLEQLIAQMNSQSSTIAGLMGMG